MKAFPSRRFQFIALGLFLIFITIIRWSNRIPASTPEVRMGSPALTSEVEASAAQVRAYLHDSLKTYDDLDSYQTEFHKEELKDNGDWQYEKMFLKFAKPFTIYMHWTEGERKGTQILYSRGNYNGNILVRPAGFLFRLIPIIQLAHDDPRVMESETHSIEHAGIGYFLTEYMESFNESLERGNVRILADESVEIEGEPARLLSILFDDPSYSYPRTDVAFSKQHGLPVEIKLHNPENELVEIYRYLKLNPNSGAEDKTFREVADSRLFNSFKETSEAGSQTAS